MSLSELQKCDLHDRCVWKPFSDIDQIFTNFTHSKTEKNFLQKKKSTLLNKLLIYIPVSHELIGKVVQEMCWVLASAETSGCNQKGKLLFSVLMVILLARENDYLNAFPHRGQDHTHSWQTQAFLLGNSKALGTFLGGRRFAWDSSQQRGFQWTEPVPIEFEGSFATQAKNKYFARKYLQTGPTIQVHLNSSLRNSPINFFETHCVNNKLCLC